MSVYPWIRRLHLWTGFVLLGFVLMYFLTGWILSHPAWFDRPPEGKPEPRRAALAWPARARTDPELALEVQRQLGLPGRAAKAVRRSGRTILIDFNRPGYRAAVRVNADSGAAEVSEQHFGWRQTAIHFHRFLGYHGRGLHKLWAAFYDLASLAMIVFSISGILLWARLMRKSRGLGWGFLSVGLGVTLATIAYLLTAP